MSLKQQHYYIKCQLKPELGGITMSKPNIWRDAIYEVLDDTSLNYSELLLNAKTELKGLNKSSRPNRLFNEQLIKLLKEGNIRIIGYDESVHKNSKGERVEKIQAFKKEGITFELIRTDKTEPMDIIVLLDQLEQIKDPKEQLKARLELLRLFEKKFILYEEDYVVFWERINSNVTSHTLDDEITIVKKVLDESLNSYEEKDYNYYSILGVDEIENKLDYYKDLKENQNNRILHVMQMPKVSAMGDGDRLWDMFRSADYLNPMVVEGEGWTSELFLKRKGIPEPEKKSQNEIRAIFRKMLFYVNAHENYNFMKNSLSWALSDEQDSIRWFELFIKNMPSQDGKLEDELGIEMPKLKKDNPKDIDQFASFLTNKIMEEYANWEEN
jgi:hypothetical protein